MCFGLNLQVVNFLLATASGAGFAVTYEINKNVAIDVGFGGRTKYPNQLYVSIGLLFMGSICMAILSVLSSIFRESNSTSGKRSSFMTGWSDYEVHMPSCWFIMLIQNRRFKKFFFYKGSRFLIVIIQFNICIRISLWTLFLHKHLGNKYNHNNGVFLLLLLHFFDARHWSD